MLRIALALQALAAPEATQRLSDPDSVSLLKRVESVQFQFMMDWRYEWQMLMRDVRADGAANPMKAPPHFDPGYQYAQPQGDGCLYMSTARYDIDRREWMAHLIKAPNRPKLSLCPIWNKPYWYEPPDERKSIDASLTPTRFPPDVADAMRRQRATVIHLLDSAARALPGDRWIAGQRVRLHVDQANPGAAKRAANECEAEFWWCFALRGYAEYAGGEVSKASETFDLSRRMMPDSVRCAWDDASMFFDYWGRQAYEGLTCAQRDSLNERVWWLADPLFVESGNERRTEHYVRRVIVELRRAMDIDERFDWRENYQGPALAEMVMRYGWPTQIITAETRPIRWARFNTRSLYLGDTTITLPLNAWCDGTMGEPVKDRYKYPVILLQSDSARFGCSPFELPPFIKCIDGEILEEHAELGFPCFPDVIVPGIRYWGPQFHTVPLWQTVLEPFKATDEGWDLAPQRDGRHWDTSWWPLEFYRRDAGPLVPLSTQVAFFRRETTAILMAGMEWDTLMYVGKPEASMVAGAIVTTGPNVMRGVMDTVNGLEPRPLVAAVPSGEALLGIEMIPRSGAGAAGRTRFGVVIPPPLRELGQGNLALSDIVLARAREGEEAPATMAELLPRMYGSTSLRDPGRVALFWELYGLATGDTVGVALRIVRKDDANLLERLGALIGVARAGDDSVVIRWTEPRPAEPTATVEAGVTIRPRGLVVDMSQLSSGRYALEIVIERGGTVSAISSREMRIRRR